MKNYLAIAKRFSRTSQEEYLSANGNEDKVRQAAEKGWLAVVEATNALLQKKGIKVPRGTRKREDLLSDLEERDKKVKELLIRAKYRTFLGSLHIDCFYDGEFSKKIVQRDIYKIKEYIKDIENM